MKKLVICILALLTFTGLAFAQRGLNCYPVFKGKIVPLNRMIVTEVRGEEMATYKLSYFKSVRFQTDSLMAGKVAELVEADILATESSEHVKNGDLLTYAMAQLKPLGITKRCLCYQAKKTNTGDWIITLLYLEGSATLEDLRSMFEKQ